MLFWSFIHVYFFHWISLIVTVSTEWLLRLVVMLHVFGLNASVASVVKRSSRIKSICSVKSPVITKTLQIKGGNEEGRKDKRPASISVYSTPLILYLIHQMWLYCATVCQKIITLQVYWLFVLFFSPDLRILLCCFLKYRLRLGVFILGVCNNPVWRKTA